jgi:flagellin-like hook-associated protein FlgL
MCDKIVCLGKRQELEDKKMKLFMALAEISSIDFDNVNLSNANSQHDAVEQFIDWTRRHKNRSNTDEAVSNTDSAIGLVDVKARAENQIQNILLKMRELAVQSATGTMTVADMTALSNTYKNYRAEVQRISADSEYNGAAVVGAVATKTIQVGTGNTANDRIAVNTYNLADSLLQIKATTGIEDQAKAQAAIAGIDTDLETNRGYIEGSGNEYDRLVEAKKQLLRAYKEAFAELERHREQARTQINRELCNILKTIAYLNVCVNHNGN